MKCPPPQFMFEIAAAKAAHDFMEHDVLAQDLVAAMIAVLDPLFDTTGMTEDLLEAIKRYLLLISSRQISNFTGFLLAFIWYRANFENSIVRRTKIDFSECLVRPPAASSNPISRPAQAARAIRGYADAVHRNVLPPRPRAWTPADEIELAPLMDALFAVELPGAIAADKSRAA